MQPLRPISADVLRWIALLVATALISVVFFDMVHGLLVPLTLAAITAAMAEPLNLWLTGRLRGRRALASTISLALMLLVVILPMMAIIAVAVSQAESLVRGIGALAGKLNAADWSVKLPDWVPFEGDLEEFWPKVLSKLGELIQAAAGFFVSSLSSVTLGAAMLFLHLFVFFYSLFFFLQMDTPILVRLLRFTGLAPETQELLNERIMSVSRATIRGTLTIAVIQGGLGGLGFWLTGVPGAAFWSVVMMVMAMLPAIGAPAVLLGGSLYLAIKGQYMEAVGLAVWATAVVSTIDNFLRPALVGRDARLHDIVILIATLGGLGMFGASGMILGPVLAGLFVTVWTTLAETFGDEAPPPPERGSHDG
ncbi:MAG: AI-2E family transporter [Jhaorihella sp.]